MTDYNIFKTWLDNLPLEKIPKTAIALCFNLYEGEDNTYHVEMIASRRYDEDDDDWACDTVSKIGKKHCAIDRTTEIQDCEQGLRHITELLNNYLKMGRFREKLLSYKVIAIGFVNGDLDVVYQDAEWVEEDKKRKEKATAKLIAKPRAYFRLRNKGSNPMWFDIDEESLRGQGSHPDIEDESSNSIGYAFVNPQGIVFENWDARKVKITYDKKDGGKLYDFCVYSSWPIVTPRFKELLETLPLGNVQFLPIVAKSVPDGDSIDLFVINICDVIDAVNWEDSKISKIGSGKYEHISLHVPVIRPSAVQGANIFRLKEGKLLEEDMLCQIIIVSTEVYNLVHKHSIKGCEFDKIKFCE